MLEGTRGRDDRLTGHGVRSGDAVIHVEPDSKRGVGGSRIGEHRLADEWIDAVRSGEDGQQQLGVLDVAGHRPDRAHVEHARVSRGRPAAGLGHETGRRP